MWKSICVCALLLGAALAYNENEEQSFPTLKGMQGLRLLCDTEEKLSVLQYYEDILNLDYVRTNEGEVDLYVSADKLEEVKSILEANEIEYEVFVEDVYQQAVDQSIDQKIARIREFQYRIDDAISNYRFTYYMDYEEIVKYIEFVALYYADLVTLEDIGKSYEGRSMYVLKISKPGKKKPVIFIDAGIHAREWIAPATAIYMIDQLLSNATNSHLLENVDYYILPVLNPDGYQFTHEKPGNRFWRKTRSFVINGCRGVDGNRNFGLKWMGPGASDNPCSETYAGPKAFSEPETVNLRNFILAQQKNIKVYLTLHSYGQYLLYPWGYTTELPPNEPTLREVAMNVAKAIESVRGVRYTWGTSANALYLAAGGSDDWAMGVGGAELSYTFELPGHGCGFVLPAKYIRLVGTETFEGLKVLTKYVQSKYPS